MGVKILAQLETAAVARGCTLSMLDTLNFQAMPFYEKQGYQTKWVQENYPKTGCKYFMVKELTE
jgi:ribosomal protein S18 acetylase RimI-like enzyme